MGLGWGVQRRWGEGTRDTEFMLEWMLFAQRVQEDCTICYFLSEAASQEPENCDGVWEIPYTCICKACTFCVLIITLGVFICKRVRCHRKSRIYLFVICRVSHSSCRSFRSHRERQGG